MSGTEAKLTMTAAVAGADKARADIKSIGATAQQTAREVLYANKALVEGYKAAETSSKAAAAATRAETEEHRKAAAMERARQAEIQRMAAQQKAAMAAQQDATRAMQAATKAQLDQSAAMKAHQDRVMGMIQQLAALAAGYLSVHAAVSLVQKGLQSNSQVEDLKLGIATVVSANQEVFDLMGKQVGASENLAAAQSEVAGVFEQMKKDAIETTATLPQLAEAMKVAVGPAMQAGISLQETEKLVVKTVQAMGALSIPLIQARTEIGGMLQGNIDQNTQLAKQLGITRTLIETWKAKGTLVKELNTRLEAYAEAGKQAGRNWSGLTSTLADNMEDLNRKMTDGAFGTIKEGLSGLIEFSKSDEMVDLAIDFGTVLQDGISGAITMAQGLGSVLFEAAKIFVDTMQPVMHAGAALGGMQVTASTRRQGLERDIYPGLSEAQRKEASSIMFAQQSGGKYLPYKLGTGFSNKERAGAFDRFVKDQGLDGGKRKKFNDLLVGSEKLGQDAYLAQSADIDAKMNKSAKDAQAGRVDLDKYKRKAKPPIDPEQEKHDQAARSMAQEAELLGIQDPRTKAMKEIAFWLENKRKEAEKLGVHGKKMMAEADRLHVAKLKSARRGFGQEDSRQLVDLSNQASLSSLEGFNRSVVQEDQGLEKSLYDNRFKPQAILDSVRAVSKAKQDEARRNELRRLQKGTVAPGSVGLGRSLAETDFEHRQDLRQYKPGRDDELINLANAGYDRKRADMLRGPGQSLDDEIALGSSKGYARSRLEMSRGLTRQLADLAGTGLEGKAKQAYGVRARNADLDENRRLDDSLAALQPDSLEKRLKEEETAWARERETYKGHHALLEKAEEVHQDRIANIRRDALAEHVSKATDAAKQVSSMIGQAMEDAPGRARTGEPQKASAGIKGVAGLAGMGAAALAVGLSGGAAAPFAGAIGTGTSAVFDLMGSFFAVQENIDKAKWDKEREIHAAQMKAAKAQEDAGNRLADAGQQQLTAIRQDKLGKIMDAIAAGKNIDVEIAKAGRELGVLGGASSRDAGVADLIADFKRRAEELEKQFGTYVEPPKPAKGTGYSGQGLLPAWTKVGDRWMTEDEIAAKAKATTTAAANASITTAVTSTVKALVPPPPPPPPPTMPTSSDTTSGFRPPASGPKSSQDWAAYKPPIEAAASPYEYPVKFTKPVPDLSPQARLDAQGAQLSAKLKDLFDIMLQIFLKSDRSRATPGSSPQNPQFVQVINMPDPRVFFDRGFLMGGGSSNSRRGMSPGGGRITGGVK